MDLDAWPTADRYVLMTLRWMVALDWSVASLSRHTGMDAGRLSELLRRRRLGVASDTVAITAQAVERALKLRGLQMGRCQCCGQVYPLPPAVKAEDQRHYGC
jgi:hypothetical protein